MQPDPLFVVNPKVPCPACGARRRERKRCEVCKKTGYHRLNLQGLWSPSPGFLVCGGPSLRKLDLSPLRERGIVSVGINQAASYAPVRAWTFGDPPKKFHHALWLDGSTLTFAPLGKLKLNIRARLPDKTFRTVDRLARDCPGTVGYSRSSKWLESPVIGSDGQPVFGPDKKPLYTYDPSSFLTTEYAHWGTGGKDSCLCSMMLGFRLLHYMGCPTIYMLGVDFNMTDRHQYAFNQRKAPRNGRYRKENAMCAAVAPVLSAAGVEVFNCNQHSNCTAFPFKPYIEALDDCRGGIPAEPFDLSNWYDKGHGKEQAEKYPDVMPMAELTGIVSKERAGA